MGEKLGSGSQLPAFTLNLTNGESASLPEDITTDFGVVLFYRGHW